MWNQKKYVYSSEPNLNLENLVIWKQTFFRLPWDLEFHTPPYALIPTQRSSSDLFQVQRRRAELISSGEYIIFNFEILMFWNIFFSTSTRSWVPHASIHPNSNSKKLQRPFPTEEVHPEAYHAPQNLPILHFPTHLSVFEHFTRLKTLKHVKNEQKQRKERFWHPPRTLPSPCFFFFFFL